ncbi:cytochrome b-c1 complex subunit 2, mitochondrial-like [Lytechinus variegatus]|uniref:cytochrome b-c1 complex subunit 2, mitochondrial-like n=1 Tax=Lytechinus variegatus TaxID=7654 RepID=UPI001BB1F293|nr:cytochrome b-c1 complex subunit 2, mitochondrial-like [Lytechinus variegatus]
MSVSTFRPTIVSLSRRWFSAQAATQARQAEAERNEVQVTKLPSGLTVASLENNSPVSRLAVIVKAGSRYEGVENLGASHCLRAFGHLTTSGASALSITRGLEEVGGSLETSTSREHVTYSIRCLRDQLDTGMFYLKNVSTGQEFRPWEVKDNSQRLLFDLSCYNDQLQLNVMEQLHSAAYRDTLGRSIYAPQYMVGKHTTQMLKDYVSSRYTAENMAIVGIGVDHSDLKTFGESFDLQRGDPSTPAAKYSGGELRNQCSSPLAYAALGVEGANLSSKDLLVTGILHQLMGSAPYIKRGSNLATSKASQAAAKASSLPHAVNCFNLPYSDSGLFGFFAITQPSDMAPVLKSLMEQFGAMTKGNVSAQDLQRAKNQLKAAVFMNLENQDALLEDIAVQALHAGSYVSPADVVKAVDGITAEDVSRVAKRIFNGKRSMAASGNLINTPYMDQLLTP